MYVLAGCALTFLALGVAQAVQQLVGDLAGSARPALLAAPPGTAWTIWGAIAAWITAPNQFEPIQAVGGWLH